jgi:hypothetical protein
VCLETLTSSLKSTLQDLIKATSISHQLGELATRLTSSSSLTLKINSMMLI